MFLSLPLSLPRIIYHKKMNIKKPYLKTQRMNLIILPTPVKGPFNGTIHPFLLLSIKFWREVFLSPLKINIKELNYCKIKIRKKINQKLSQGICRRTKCAKFQTNQLRFGLWECPEVLGYKSTHRYTDTHTDTQQHRHSQIIAHWSWDQLKSFIH